VGVGEVLNAGDGSIIEAQDGIGSRSGEPVVAVVLEVPAPTPAGEAVTSRLGTLDRIMKDIGSLRFRLQMEGQMGDGLDGAIERFGKRVSALRSGLEGMVQAFEEHVAVPDRNCSCHLNPPCGDCVTWGFAREAVETAEKLLKEGGA